MRHLLKSTRALPVTGVEIMRRSTTKAAAAIVALSVAIPALANEGDYFIGPDGSIEYRDGGATAPTSSAPLSGLMGSDPVYSTMEPVRDVAVELPAAPYVAPAPMTYEAAPVAAPAPIVQDLSMELMSNAHADVAPAPMYSEPYASPMAVEVMPTAPIMHEPVMAQPMMMETITHTPVHTPSIVAQPVMAQPAPMTYEVAAPAPTIVTPAPTMMEYAAPPVVQPVAMDYTTLSDPSPLTSIEALPVAAPSGRSFASRGDGGYGRTAIDRGGESEAGQSTDIFVSKSAVLNLPAEAAEVSVSDPTAVRAVLRTARQIVLIGLRVGSTNVIVFDENNKQILNLDVTIRYDLRPLRAALKRNFPNTLIEVESLLGEVVLTGAASGPGEATEIRNLVRRYLYSAALGSGEETDIENIDFVDRLATDSDDQILLKVRVAEMRRSVVRQFGVDWSLASNAAGAIASGAFGGSLPGAVSAFDALSSNSGGLSANIGGSIGSTDFGSLVKALERHSVMRTLAEPTLTAVSGETASFLAGGQFPFPVSVDEGEIGYDFRDFGVALEFTPVVVGDGRISLQIATEVSELTNEGALDTGAIKIPGISVRRANTTVELPSGGTMSIAGMLLQRDSASQAGVPGIKNVPIVGQLFSSNEFNRDETELVILVTPYVVKPGQERDFRLPTDGFAPASDMDFYLLGRLHKVYGTGNQDVAAARQALNAPLGFIIE